MTTESQSITRKPQLSVVIASHNARSSILECLAVVEKQREGRDVEILIVDNSKDGTADIAHRQFPDLNIVHASNQSLIPELWETGIRQCAGDIIALTSAHFIPASNWMDEILKAHQSPYAGIGGAIENDPAGGWVDWAVYFCRYSLYMLPFPEHTVQDFAADNASYKRWALDRCRHIRQRGFWEVFVHAELRKQNLELWLTPAIVVYHKKSFDLSRFLKQRFQHGKKFGGRRAKNFTIVQRLIYILVSPLIPFVLLSRIMRQVWKKRRHGSKFLLSLPVLILFLLSWSAGELSGYLGATENQE